METATLTSPPRPIMVQPVQKSLSLPSYARASGEGIDHKLIFAALEQREKIRRKSKIFKDKEKTGATRPNYFCLPLPSSAKCRETSLSSDTSCSSLEFQKPKYRNSPRNERKDLHSTQNGVQENVVLAPSLSAVTKLDLNNNSDEGNRITSGAVIDREYSEKERSIRISRSTIGSSDSMEKTDKSSKSSNDSLSRKERLVAIKARVEAERERTLCHSSSEEEEEISLRITRHNSDGVIHRTVREVKSKSSKIDKKIKRRTPEDSTARRAARKQHKSLCIPSTIDLDSWKPPIVRSGSSFSLQKELNDINADFFGIESRNEQAWPQAVLNNNYYSDICNGNYKSRFVKPIIAKIEAKEQSLFEQDMFLKGRTALNPRNAISPVDTRLLDESLDFSFDFDSSKPARPEKPPEMLKHSFITTSRAPTPPPRSPKSTAFVNKAIIHHQHTGNFYGEACSLERKKMKQLPKLPQSITTQSNSIDDIKNDLLSSRRKTCSNFPQVEEYFKERPRTPTLQNKMPQHFPPRSPDLPQRLCGVVRKSKLTDFSNIKIVSQSETQGNRWEKLELNSEKKFNSLESRTPPPNEVNVGRWKFPLNKKPCYLCSGVGSSHECDCSNENLSISLQKGETCVNRSEIPPSPPEKLIHSVSSQEINSTKAHLQRELRRKESLEELECLSRQDATEDLNSAMEELESVYRSLRMSTENLSVKEDSNPVSNNLDKSNVINPTSNSNSSLCSKSFEKVSKSDNGTITKSIPTAGIIENEASHRNPSATPIDAEDGLIDGRSITDALCIEELFGDLTEQLDIEQKLLQQTRKKPPSSPTPKNLIHPRLGSPQGCLSPSNLNAIYVNDISDRELRETTAISNVKQKVLAKKKHKAVRSLSENLVSLMMKDNRDADSTNKKMNTLTEKPDKSHSKMNKTATDSTKLTDNDEIWQIRVSMDPGKPPADPPLPSTKDASTQLRLHSALRRPNENSVQREVPEASQNSSQDKTTSRLSEKELEELLSTLLSDVSNKPVNDRKILSSPQANELNENDVTSKGVTDYVTKWYFNHNMEPMVQAKNGKPVKLLPDAATNGKLDNVNINQNNNEPSDVQCSSFIPVRIRGSSRIRTCRMSDNNDQSPALQRNSALLESNGNPRAAWLSSRGIVRRHSVGLEDFSDLSIYSGNRNSNRGKRLPSALPAANKHCSSDAATNSHSAANPAEAQSQIENQNAELDVKSSCNGSPGTYSSVNFYRAGSYEKLKDKSFVRKSSLNRLEFVEQACLNSVQTSPSRQQRNIQDKQQSSSEAFSDHDRKPSVTRCFSPLSMKRKNVLGRHSEKEHPTAALLRQDAIQENLDSGEKKPCWLSNPKYRDGSLKIQSKKNSKVLLSQFKMKAFSAGEHDSSTDNTKIGDQSKVCFSSQETCDKEQSITAASTSLAFEEQIIDDFTPMSKKILNEEISVVSNCDMTSHNGDVEVLPKSKSGNEAAAADQNYMIPGPDNDCVGERMHNSHYFEQLQIDKDLFNSPDSVQISSLRPFPVEETLASTFENNESNACHSSSATSNQQDSVVVEMDQERLQSSAEPMEFQVSRSCTPVESDRESSKQPSSILRRKMFDERRERPGILKNAEDKLGSRHIPSILKHRESSEEKDNWIQSDLHSILKKSTSEDESSTNSLDIRPILKNTSTDDESPGLSSKPKPILKKRTSFSEECSYACYRGSELKPILKKTSIVDMSEEQPKPILKTRRKSEEATATTMEFPLGARPRAYSADRGICKAAKEDDNPT